LAAVPQFEYDELFDPVGPGADHLTRLAAPASARTQSIPSGVVENIVKERATCWRPQVAGENPGQQ